MYFDIFKILASKYHPTVKTIWNMLEFLETNYKTPYARGKRHPNQLIEWFHWYYWDLIYKEGNGTLKTQIQKECNEWSFFVMQFKFKQKELITKIFGLLAGTVPVNNLFLYIMYMKARCSSEFTINNLF